MNAFSFIHSIHPLPVSQFSFTCPFPCVFCNSCSFAFRLSFYFGDLSLSCFFPSSGSLRDLAPSLISLPQTKHPWVSFQGLVILLMLPGILTQEGGIGLIRHCPSRPSCSHHSAIFPPLNFPLSKSIPQTIYWPLDHTLLLK